MKPSRLSTYASFTKIEHTVFSLPLIFSGTLLYLHGMPSPRLIVLILFAALGGRVMAMGLNRIIDVHVDKINPRTKGRELPSGKMNLYEGWGIVIVAGGIYLLSAASISPICLQFSPIPILLFVGYPYLKRFTSTAHLGLGLAWAVGPLGGWLAASGSLSEISEVFWLWLFSLLWVAGFDIIYATLDEASDRATKIHALPARIGKGMALKVSALLHLLALGSLVILWRMELLGFVSFLWLLVIGAFFIWQHIVAEKNPAFAFFRLNGVIGFLVFGMVVTGI